MESLEGNFPLTALDEALGLRYTNAVECRNLKGEERCRQTNRQLEETDVFECRSSKRRTGDRWLSMESIATSEMVNIGI